MNIPSRAELEEHKKSNHPEVNTPSLLAAHKHHECIICEAKFPAGKDLKEHIEEEHSHDCEICIMKFKVKSLLRSHNQSIHNFKCDHCDERKVSQEDLNKHIDANHSFNCSVCNIKLPNKSDLEKHQSDQHTMCMICSVDLGTKEKVNIHMKECHMFICDVCSFTCTSEGSIEDHILDNHATPDTDNWYKCDDCTFQSQDKRTFGEHFKQKHGSEAPTKKLEEENRIIKNNFERLEGMYHDSLEEVNRVKSDCEARVIAANDNYTVLKAENEVLKEKVDILFKLGRSYLDRNNAANNTEEKKEDNDEEIEVEVIDEDTENIESLKEWTKNKMRGFKRANPASTSIPKATPVEASKTKTSPNPNDPKKSVGEPKPNSKPKHPNNQENHSSMSKEETAPNADNDSSPETDHERFKGKYCHYFVNQGKCNFEERSGFKCRFEHKVAPMCNFGVSCTRTKCMFSHPQVAGGNHTFLEKTRGFPPMMNPWQMINPWMNPPNQFIPNPWNGQGTQNRQ